MSLRIVIADPHAGGRPEGGTSTETAGVESWETDRGGLGNCVVVDFVTATAPRFGEGTVWRGGNCLATNQSVCLKTEDA